MEIVFLGTGSMFPTKKRAHPCVFLRDEKTNLMFDCGEGAQRQMRIAKISPTKSAPMDIIPPKRKRGLGRLKTPKCSGIPKPYRG